MLLNIQNLRVIYDQNLKNITQNINQGLSYLLRKLFASILNNHSVI
jgi:hypothetical protein